MVNFFLSANMHYSHATSYKEKHSFEAELNEAKANVTLVSKIVGICVILNVLLVFGLGGLVVNAVIHHNLTDALTNDLEAMQKKQNTSEMASRDSLDSIDRQLVVLNNKSAQQVAFYVSTPTGKLVGTRSPTFARITLNIGGGYNVSTGMFHPPVAGVYLFSSTLKASLLRPDNTQIYCYIYLGSELLGAVRTDEGKGDSSSVSIFLRLGVTDVISYNCVNWKFVAGGVWTSFTGALIKAD